MNSAVGIIPARWQSTRFPGKPLHLIAGKPLLRHVWERCRRAKSLDEVIIATDDMRIAEAAFSWGAEVALTSPSHHSGTDRAAAVARNAKGFDYIINIQGDEPLIEPRLINRLVRELKRNPDLQMVTAAHPFGKPAGAISPHQVKVLLDRENNALAFSRAPIALTSDSGFRTAESKQGLANPSSRILRHQGIYGYTRDLLLRFVRWKPTAGERAESLEQLRALENGVRIHVVVTASGSPGVDTPEDARAIERQLRLAKRRVARAKRSNRK